MARKIDKSTVKFYAYSLAISAVISLAFIIFGPTLGVVTATVATLMIMREFDELAQKYAAEKGEANLIKRATKAFLKFHPNRLSDEDYDPFIEKCTEIMRELNETEALQKVIDKYKTELQKPSFDFRTYLMRSDNLLEALKSLAKSGELKEDSPIYHMLQQMEAHQFLDEYWKYSFAPQTMEDICLRLTNQHYIRADMENEQSWLTNGLLALEAMINISQEALDKDLKWDTWDESFVDACLIPRPGAKQSAEEYFGEELLKGADYGVRLRLAYLFESLHLPFRLNTKFRLDLSNKIVYVEYVVPAEHAFSFIYNKEVYAEKAKLYALRLATYLAKEIFKIDPKLKGVYIKNAAYTYMDLADILYFSFTKEQVDRLDSLILDPGASYQDFLNSLSQDVLIYKENENWFDEIEPPLHFNDMRYFKPENVQAASISKLPLSAETQKLCYAKSASDLEYREDALKSEILYSIKEFIKDDTTTQELVQHLAKLKEKYPDPDIAKNIDACARDLVEGTIEANDKDAVLNRFYVSNSLSEMLKNLETRSVGDLDPQQVVSWITDATEEFLPEESIQDSDSCTYRVFETPLERISYNKYLKDERDIKLLPLSYLASLQIRSGILMDLDKLDEAEPLIKELRRIAPTNMKSILREVSYLEAKSDIFGAVELLKEAISHSLSRGTTAWLFYRLAYMYHQLGNDEVALACYEKTLSYGMTEIYEDASQEMQMLQGKFNLEEIPEDRLDDTLDAASIPLGLSLQDRQYLARVVASLVNDGLYETAGHILYETNLQDIDRDVLISITPPRGFNPMTKLNYLPFDEDDKLDAES